MLTTAQAAALARGRALGGLAVKDKIPPARCPRCGQSMKGRSWHSYLGHLGLHGYADAHHGGDLEAAQRRLRENGLAVQDPYPENGAWPRYQPIGKAAGRKGAERPGVSGGNEKSPPLRRLSGSVSE